jgi:PBP superfamily domain
MNSSNIASLIRGVGSSTTYEVMNALGDHYNSTPGCITSASGQPFPLDGSCVDFDSGQAGVQPQSESGARSGRMPTPTTTSCGITTKSARANGIQTLVGSDARGYLENVRFARSSRAPSGSDISGLRFVAYAKDAAPWIKYDDSAVGGEGSDGVSDLSVGQLQGIFASCPITNWSAVGGANRQIIVWAALRGSDISSTFEHFFGAGNSSTNCIPPAA